MQLRKFKDCPIPCYFWSDDPVIKKLVHGKFPRIFQKVSAIKIRQFGQSQVIRSNPDVKYFGQDVLDIPTEYEG